MGKHISSSSLTTFEDCLSDLKAHYSDLYLIWLEMLQPKLDKNYRDSVRQLMWDRLSLLEQTVSDFDTFFHCVMAGDEFG